MEMENPAAVCECTERHDKAERRNLMLITSAVLQWMLMIVCIVYLAVLYHQSHQAPSLTKQFVKTYMQPGASPNNTEAILEWTEGNMDVRNGCIEILIDGYYLLNAQGLIRDKMPGKINFHFEHKTAMGSDDRDIFTQSVLQDTVAVTLIKMLYRDTKVCITSENLVMDQFDVIMYLL